MVDLNDMVRTYVELRDAKKALQERHKTELAPYDEGLRQIEDALQAKLDETGQTSAKTPSGTAYKQMWTAARVADWDKVLDYIVEQERYDLLEKRINKTVVEEIGQVPGVDVERGWKVNVRRS